MSTASPLLTPIAARPIKLIVVHCSASPNGKPITPDDIDRWHQLRGFKRDAKALRGTGNTQLKHIGYHYVIELDGFITPCREESEIGAHVAGFNQHSIGICLVGTDAFTAPQWAALRALVAGLTSASRYPMAKVMGHRDLSPDQDKDGIVEPFEWLKICPGFDVAAWCADDMKPVHGHVHGEIASVAGATP